jgi:transcriptional regulator with XRE-family HTH domain
MTEDYRTRLHEARIGAGLSQRALAERIGCSDSTISLVETGQRELGAGKLIGWAEACGVSLDWVAGTGRPRAAPADDALQLDLELGVTA